MTTAQARAVPFVFANLRNALMASASAGLLVALAPAAQAASCATTAGNDTCVITLGNAAEIHDGLGQATGGADTIQFDANGLTISATQFTFGTGSGTLANNFANFELAEVINNTSLTLTSATNDPAPRAILGWTITAGSTLTVSGTGGNAINDLVSVIVNGTFSVVESETIGTLSGSGAITIAAGETLSADGSTATNPANDIIGTTYSGTLSGSGGFKKIGSGMLKLTGASPAFTGALTVAGGTLEIGNGSAIVNATAVNITSGELTSKGVATYNINAPVTITGGRLTGNAVIVGNVTSNGGLQPGNTSVPTGYPIGNPGQDMGTIVINGNYSSSGSNAYVGMFIDIDAAAPAGGNPGVTHDFLNILNSVTGTNTTKFAVASFDNAAHGAATTGDGILVIRIAGTSTGTEFVQSNALTAGPYQYLLRYVANYTGGAGADGYFLQSAARDEIYAHAGLLSASQSLIRGCFRDDQRIPDSPKGATYGRAWIGYRQGNSTFGADTGVEQDQDFSCTTGGMDWRMGNGWFGGVSGGFGSSNSDIVVPSGTGKMDGDARVIEAYAAFTSSNFFLNLSAGYADMDWIYASRMGGGTAASGGFIGSAQAGVGLGLEPLAVKLIGMVNYDGTNCGEDCFGFAVGEDTGLIEAKAALRFDGVTWGGSVRPWAQVSYSTVLSDGVNTITGGPFVVSSDTNDELLTIDAGLQSYLDENLALYLDGGYKESLSKDISGYHAGIGAKLYW